MKTVRPALSLFGLFALAALAAVNASPSIAKEPPPKTWVASRAANLRAAPSGQSPVIASVPKDAALISFEPCARGWCAVEYRGVRGWIFDALLVEAPQKTAPAPAPAAPPLARASLQKSSPAPANESIRRSYRVIGLGVEESLPVREAPLDTARMLGSLPPAANGVAALEACLRQWCLIEHDGVRGYVRSRFLGRTEEAPSPRYGVEGGSNLAVFSFGGPGADIVGEIPFYAGGIVPVGPCGAEWCHIRYLGLVGFVEARRLRPEPAPRS